ncbi:MAG: ABC transporter ATP-binding protein [Pseudomonadota bacterium]
MPSLELRHISKSFGSVQALADLNLKVEQGELMCLLGPSGCGKTTTLRIIAGFEGADAGGLRLDEADITRVPPERRDIGLVFQNYALFPHLTAAENVGFGLKMRRWERQRIATAVEAALKLVRLEGVGERYPRQLSGGQQQRIALARAIAIQPHLLLLDEPLSNLDAKLRVEMREEIHRVQRAVGITTVFVTHDQEEALTLADRMAVMDRGAIVQLGTPYEVYERPTHPFVAGFIGQANLIRGRVEAREGRQVRLVTASGLRVVGEGDGLALGAPAVAVIRHERIALGPAPADAPNAFLARVEGRTYLGASILYALAVGEERLGTAQASRGGTIFEPGQMVHISWHAADCLVLPAAEA